MRKVSRLQNAFNVILIVMLGAVYFDLFYEVNITKKVAILELIMLLKG